MSQFQRSLTLLSDRPRCRMQELKGTVTRAEPFGIFVQLDQSTVTGLVHVSELSEKYVKNVQADYPPGRKVQAVVLSIDTAKGRLGLGMKAKYFTQTAPDGENAHAEDDENVEAQRSRDHHRMNVDVETALLAAYDESDTDDNDKDQSDVKSDQEDHMESDSSGQGMHDVDVAGNNGEGLELDQGSEDVIEDDGKFHQPQDHPLQRRQMELTQDPYGYLPTHKTRCMFQACQSSNAFSNAGGTH